MPRLLNGFVKRPFKAVFIPYYASETKYYINYKSVFVLNRKGVVENANDADQITEHF